MHRKKRLPIGLVSRQNGDPRFIPPVSFGADYAKQVQDLRSTVTTLKEHVVLQTQKAERQAGQIAEYIRRLKQLDGNGLGLEKLEKELEKCRKKNAADLQTNNKQEIDLKLCKAQLTECKDEQTRLKNEHRRLMARGKDVHSGEIRILKEKEDALGVQIAELETEIKVLKATVGLHETNTNKRDAELARLQERLGKLLRSDAGDLEGGPAGKRSKPSVRWVPPSDSGGDDGGDDGGGGGGGIRRMDLEEKGEFSDLLETKSDDGDAAAAGAAARPPAVAGPPPPGRFLNPDGTNPGGGGGAPPPNPEEEEKARRAQANQNALEIEQMRQQRVEREAAANAHAQAHARDQAAVDTIVEDRDKSRRVINGEEDEGAGKTRRVVPAAAAKQQSEHQVSGQLKLLSLHKLTI